MKHLGAALILSLLGFASWMAWGQQSYQTISPFGPFQVLSGAQGGTQMDATIVTANQVAVTTGNPQAPYAWQAFSGGVSTSWSSLTAPTVNNSVAATVDTQQALTGHFDTSAAASSALFSLGENAASTRAAGAGSTRVRMLNVSTLAGSTATPFVFAADGFVPSGANPGNLFMTNTGTLTYLGNSDAITGGGGTAVNLTGGASATANSAGGIFLTGGANSSSGTAGNIGLNGGTASSGAGGNVSLTPGASSSGASGSVQILGPWSYSAAEADLSYTYSTPTTGQTVTLATNTETAVIEPAGTLAALTVTLPSCAASYDGKLARFLSTQAITALTVNATAGTVVDAPASLAVGAGAAYLCRGSTAKWYRLY